MFGIGLQEMVLLGFFILIPLAVGIAVLFTIRGRAKRERDED